MAEKSTHYNLDILRGNDIYNPNIEFNNFEKIDTEMYKIDTDTVHTAIHVLSGQVNTLTRTNTEFNIFKFVATAPYTANQTFTVDSKQVSASTTNGQPLETNCYVIGATVLCALNGTNLTLFVQSSGYPSSYYAPKGDTDKTLKEVEDIAETALHSSEWSTLWENNNVTTFGSQSMRLNTQGYKWFLVSFIQFLNYPYSLINCIVTKGRSVSPLMVLGSNLELAYRNIENLTDNSIEFSNCYKFVPGTTQQIPENTWLIPYKIIGIKK